MPLCEGRAVVVLPVNTTAECQILRFSLSDLQCACDFLNKDMYVCFPMPVGNWNSVSSGFALPNSLLLLL